MSVGCSFLLLPIVVLAGAWRLGGASALEDDLIYYLPMRAYIGDRLWHGELPLWNPLVGMGTSIAADPQSGLWYPPTWLFALLPPLWAYPATIVLHFALAGTGMYRFLRAQRLDWRAAWLAAVAFEFCGYLVAHRVHLTIHHAAAWLPWIFLGWERFAQTRARRHFVLAAGCLGLQMLVQHVQVSIITGSLLTAYVFAVLAPRGRWSLLWQYPLGMFIGVMISGVQLVPTWLHAGQTARASSAYYVFIENAWEPISSLLMVFPMLFGSRTPNLWSQPWWGVSHFCEQSAYASVPILLLALMSIPLITRDRRVAFWWSACLVALVIALGDRTPLSKILFHVPIYRNLRVPARWILVWSTALPILSAILLDQVMRNRPAAESLTRWMRLGSLLVISATVLTAGFFLLPGGADAAPLRAALRLTNPAVVWPLVLIILSSLLLLGWARSHHLHRLTALRTDPQTLSAHRRDAGATWVFGWALSLLCVVDLALIAAVVDVDTRTYARKDLTTTPELARAIAELNPQPGERLLVPRFHSDYERPLELLWPQTNMRHGINTFNCYGPFWPVANRMLLRFMPWGSSEEMLYLLRHPALMRALGIRFLAVRSPQEQALLSTAMIPELPRSEMTIIPRVPDGVPVHYGRDVLWPVKIDAPGVYLLALDARPVTGSASRWFVRLETKDGRQIDQTKAVEPADLAVGKRRMRFMFVCDQAVDEAFVRVKSEMGQALWAGRPAFGRIAGGEPDEHRAAFQFRKLLADGTRLYELADSRPLVYWADQCAEAVHLADALERCLWPLASHTVRPTIVLDESPATGEAATCGSGQARYDRLSGHEVVVDGQPTGNAGILVFNETYDAGWEATVDGRPVPILRINGIGQGVRVAGSDLVRVRWVYRPRGLLPGSLMTLAGVLILAGLGCRTAGPPRT